MKQNKKRLCSRRWKVCLGAGLFLVCLFLWGRLTEWQAYIGPQYKETDLKPVIEAAEARETVSKTATEAAVGTAEGDGAGPEVLTDARYDLIYHQTGLGRQAVDSVLKKKDAEETLLRLQEAFFQKPNYICIRDNWFSQREQTVDENGEIESTVEFAGIEDGDILITKSSHIYGWRNGHAALVVDAGRRKTLEAIVIGENTGLRSFRKWEKYPNALVLRLAGADKEERAQIAAWAKENMLDIPYRLTAGFFGSKESAPGTQCAHLVWRAYKEFGYDIDPDGGWVVTPQQLAGSPLLEVVQVYGMDPDDPWP